MTTFYRETVLGFILLGLLPSIAFALSYNFTGTVAGQESTNPFTPQYVNLVVEGSLNVNPLESVPYANNEDYYFPSPTWASLLSITVKDVPDEYFGHIDELYLGGLHHIDADHVYNSIGFVAENISYVGDATMLLSARFDYPEDLFPTSGDLTSELSTLERFITGSFSVAMIRDDVTEYEFWGSINSVSSVPAPVPEPSTVVLFGSGLLAAIGAVRKRGRKYII